MHAPQPGSIDCFDRDTPRGRRQVYFAAPDQSGWEQERGLHQRQADGQDDIQAECRQQDLEP